MQGTGLQRRDLRERVVDAADGGLSARQAAERFGVGVSTAIVWVRRARLARGQRGDKANPKAPSSTSVLIICSA